MMFSHAISSSLLSLILSCQPPNELNTKGLDTAQDTASGEAVDGDGDGYSGDEDCDDTDSSIYSGAPETCDEVDNDCDDEVDEDAGDPYYRDSDGDGHGDPGEEQVACAEPDGFVSAGTDCDDDNAEINPDALEICDPDELSLDNDCDGLVDAEDDSLDPSTAGSWYPDNDGDGYGDAANSILACSQPSDTTDDGTDCDDTNAEVFPEAEEVCDGVDNDCDGTTDGDILFTAFTSTYVYQGVETLETLQTEVQESSWLCSTSLESTDSFSGPLTCGSGDSDIGYELALTFFVTEETVGTWSFRLGPDFGRGGVLFLNETEVDQVMDDDLWWNGSWDNSEELLQGGAELAAGTHTFHAFGFEDCCSGPNALQYSVDDSDWASITQEGQGLNCDP